MTINSVDKYIQQIKPVVVNGQQLKYFISPDGTIFDENMQIKEPFKCTNGRYYAVHLKINGIDKKRMVHRLVAETFIPNPDPEHKTQVNHIDCNGLNNHVENLEWVTGIENIHHTINMGHQVIGVKHKNSKHSEKQIHQVCSLLEDNMMPFVKILKITGVSIKTIKNIKFHNGWHHIAKFYNINKISPGCGPRFSEDSLVIYEMILALASDEEILKCFHDIGADHAITLKSLKDRIYHIRKITGVRS